MKIHGQCHACGQRSRPHCWLNDKSIYLLSISHQSALPFLRYCYLKFFYYLENPRSRSWQRSTLTASFSRLWQSILSFIVLWQSDQFVTRHSKFLIWPWKFKVKVNPIGHILGLEFHQYAYFSFHGNQTIFGWDTANSILDLETSRSRSWPRSHFRPRVQSICLLFVSWQLDHFWLRYSKFHIRPWKFKVKVTTKIDQNLIR